MNIENLVPPLELCQKIPDGEFSCCFAYWAEEWNINGNTLDGEEFETMISVVSDVTFIKTEQKPTQEIVEKFKSNRTRFVKDFYPAPTLQEILEKIGGDPKVSVVRACKAFGEWRVDAQNENGRCCYSLFLEDKPAISALRLWLELKGVE